MAVELFELQLEGVAVYRAFCRSKGIRSGTIRDWREIPALPTAAFKEYEVSSLGDDRCAVFYSSGTTRQTSSRHYHSAASLEVYEASADAWFRRRVAARMGGGRFPVLSLTPGAEVAPNSSLVHMFEMVRRRFGDSESQFAGRVDSEGAWHLDGARAEGALEAMRMRGRPGMVLGTAFSFVHLIDWLRDQGRRTELPAGTLVMETGGYKGRSRILPKTELHAGIGEFLDVPGGRILCEYGMSELSSQAYLEQGVFVFPPWARAMVVSPETMREVPVGEQGLIRIVDLANARSVMALQTEDLAVRHETGFELLGRAVVSEPRGCSLMSS
jgi:hypothetical protein